MSSPRLYKTSVKMDLAMMLSGVTANVAQAQPNGLWDGVQKVSRLTDSASRRHRRMARC